MPSARPPCLPAHTEVAAFLQGFLPPQANVTDVPFLFHTPRHPLYAPERQRVSRFIFGVTATTGVYAALNDADVRQAPACFLHRPWSLDRRRVRRGSLVFASHNAFDANLTVGWNEALGARLGLRIDNAICIQGYKGNSDRKIGLVAKLAQATPLTVLVEQLKAEFAGAGELFVPQSLEQHLTGSMIDIVAIMNAFHPDEISRVLSAVRDASWLEHDCDGTKLLYLTGAARDYGLEAAAKANMPALCVGHRACEEWGVRYLAEQLRNKWPDVDVVEVLEEEESDIRQMAK
ncbi:uncharacterized protein HMPREF1541_06994 [Cyphellophora europaea CBS 101466]|uniref:Uncharacterized protein n=1 Tax=Cyphellophora europaea (strain CBS 101466) TaxID=1220924 RepID=W2RR82_CYPE1|nr:uncharacterized protein HMPREF1541_06994 [Cyphellophora europaea CBS 101466]ETN38952.1 hypothetical protein HMPREF1541_06994 [Cyphellophora europaea CBS 101466]